MLVCLEMEWAGEVASNPGPGGPLTARFGEPTMSIPSDQPIAQHGHTIPAGDVELYDALAEFPFEFEAEADHDPYEWDDSWDEFRWELGPEPVEPSDEDWRDYCKWSDRLETMR